MALIRKRWRILLLLSATIVLGFGWTALGRSISPQVQAHPGLSVYPLRDARDAFATRVHLARQAERTLDVQYDIRRNDMRTSRERRDPLRQGTEYKFG